MWRHLTWYSIWSSVCGRRLVRAAVYTVLCENLGTPLSMQCIRDSFDFVFLRAAFKLISLKCLLLESLDTEYFKYDTSCSHWLGYVHWRSWCKFGKFARFPETPETPLCTYNPFWGKWIDISMSRKCMWHKVGEVVGCLENVTVAHWQS